MGELIDPAPLRAAIEEKVSALFELNQRIATVLRKQAKDFEEIGASYGHLANRAYEIAALTAELAVVAASNAGDIIIAEFGLGEGISVDEDGDDVDEEGSNGR